MDTARSRSRPCHEYYLPGASPQVPKAKRLHVQCSVATWIPLKQGNDNWHSGVESVNFGSSNNWIVCLKSGGVTSDTNHGIILGLSMVSQEKEW